MAKKKGAGLKIKIMEAVANSELTIRFDDDPETDVVVGTNKKGKAKFKSKESGLSGGDHTYAVIHGEAVCAEGETTC